MKLYYLNYMFSNKTFVYVITCFEFFVDWIVSKLTNYIFVKLLYKKLGSL